MGKSRVPNLLQVGGHAFMKVGTHCQTTALAFQVFPEFGEFSLHDYPHFWELLTTTLTTTLKKQILIQFTTQVLCLKLPPAPPPL